MNRTALRVACFPQSVAMIPLHRGVYFYTQDTLDFWLGLLLYLTY